MDPTRKLLTLYGQREKDLQEGDGSAPYLERHFGVFVRHVQVKPDS